MSLLREKDLSLTISSFQWTVPCQYPWRRAWNTWTAVRTRKRMERVLCGRCTGETTRDNVNGWQIFSKKFQITKGIPPRSSTVPPKQTRKTCIRGGFISTGNPCPICRDEYLVLDYRNVKLLQQFISEESGEVLSYRKTGVCQKRHLELLVAVRKAMEHGYLTYDVPFRQYNYEDYYVAKTGASKVWEYWICMRICRINASVIECGTSFGHYITLIWDQHDGYKERLFN